MTTNRLVYVSDQGPGAHCPRCGRRRGACACGAPARPAPARGGPAKASPPLPRDGAVRVWRDRKQRRGKVVTVVAGLPGQSQALEVLAQELKRLCGSGGTVKDGQVEVQCDHCDRVAEHLSRAGYRVKLVGG